MQNFEIEKELKSTYLLKFMEKYGRKDKRYFFDDRYILNNIFFQIRTFTF